VSTRTKKAEAVEVVAEKAVTIKNRTCGPSTFYSRELAEEIVLQMAEGMTLIEICKAPGMPTTRAVRAWARDDKDGFQEVYKRAREMQAHAVAEMVLQDARDATDAGLGRLHMDAGKWFAAKLLPRVYSDRVAIDAKFELEDNRSASDIATAIAIRQARLAITNDDNDE
jgi:hypothetical protein